MSQALEYLIPTPKTPTKGETLYVMKDSKYKPYSTMLSGIPQRLLYSLTLHLTKFLILFSIELLLKRIALDNALFLD
jgi:hypothetical protein